MMSKINYFFEEIKVFKYGLPPKMWVKACVAEEGWKVGSLNFIFCSDKYLQKINKKYLKKSYFTDVISFETSMPDFIKNSRDSVVFGDVFISIDRIKENKKLHKTVFSAELKRVMIHGVLHLIGFRDSSKKERAKMRQRENFHISLN